MNPLEVGAVLMAASYLDLDALIETLTGGRVGVAWVFFGLLAQMMIAGCLVAHWRASRRYGRIAIPLPTLYVALLATVMLLVYASIRHDLVFVIGQLLGVVIVLRILDLLRALETQRQEPDRSRFPQVKPDTAEIDLKAVQKPKDGDSA
ncbi:MAG: lipid-A-disaccharide synthase N-terminal domain-containing protein [Phycisphaerae bacterium]